MTGITVMPVDARTVPDISENISEIHGAMDGTVASSSIWPRGWPILR